MAKNNNERKRFDDMGTKILQDSSYLVIPVKLKEKRISKLNKIYWKTSKKDKAVMFNSSYKLLKSIVTKRGIRLPKGTNIVPLRKKGVPIGSVMIAENEEVSYPLPSRTKRYIVKKSNLLDGSKRHPPYFTEEYIPDDKKYLRGLTKQMPKTSKLMSKKAWAKMDKWMKWKVGKEHFALLPTSKKHDPLKFIHKPTRIKILCEKPKSLKRTKRQKTKAKTKTRTKKR